MKRTIIIFTAAMMVVSASACSKKEENTTLAESIIDSTEKITSSTEKPAFEPIDYSLDKADYKPDYNVVTSSTLSNDEVIQFVGTAFASKAFSDSKGMYTYTDLPLGFLYAVSDNSMSYETYAEFIPTESKENSKDNISFTIKGINTNDDMTSLANTYIALGEIEGVSPDDYKVDAVYQVIGEGEDFEACSSLYLIKINGEWKLDYLLASAMNSGIGETEIEEQEEEIYEETESEKVDQ